MSTNYNPNNQFTPICGPASITVEAASDIVAAAVANTNVSTMDMIDPVVEAVAAVDVATVAPPIDADATNNVTLEDAGNGTRTKPHYPKWKPLISNVNMKSYVELLVNILNLYECLSLDSKGNIVNTKNECWELASMHFYRELSRHFSGVKGEKVTKTKNATKKHGTEFKKAILSRVHEILKEMHDSNSISAVTYHSILYNKICEYKMAQAADKERKKCYRIAKENRAESMDTAESMTGLKPSGYKFQSSFTLSKQNLIHSNSKKKWDASSLVLQAGEDRARAATASAELVGKDVYKPGNGNDSDDPELSTTQGGSDTSITSVSVNKGRNGRRSATPQDMQMAVLSSKDMFSTPNCLSGDSFRKLSETAIALVDDLGNGTTSSKEKRKLDHYDEMIAYYERSIIQTGKFDDGNERVEVLRKKIKRCLEKKDKLMEQIDELSDEENIDS